MQTNNPVLVIYGPTASGKSALAMRVADARAAVIINADAMQCYDGLPILTARPTATDIVQQTHLLYGLWQPQQHGNVAQWLSAAASAITQAWANGKLPILVGGTGMYLKLLMEGLSDVPTIPADIRTQVEAMPPEARYAMLQARDGLMASRLNAGDTQRVFRALEVVLATGQSLADWQGSGATPLLPQAQYRCVSVQVPREQLYANIDQRFERMLQAGALDEVKTFLANHPEGTTPIFKAVGLPELASYLAGALSLEEATALAQQKSRNYAKRQMTWGRGQFGHALAVNPDISTEELISALS